MTVKRAPDGELTTWSKKARIRVGVLGTSLTAVAQAVGMHRQQLQVLLKADNAMQYTLTRLEDALGVPSGWLSVPVTVAVAAAEAARFDVPTWAQSPRKRLPRGAAGAKSTKRKGIAG